jgi:hypothetical protein
MGDHQMNRDTEIADMVLLIVGKSHEMFFLLAKEIDFPFRE